MLLCESVLKFAVSKRRNFFSPSLLNWPWRAPAPQTMVDAIQQRRWMDNHMKEERLSKRISVKKNCGSYGKIVTIPNILSIFRISLTPVIGYMILHHSFIHASILLFVATATDVLDGFIARNVHGQRSFIGSFLDPVADKLLISALFVTMACVDLVPFLLAAVVLSRDASLIVGGFVKRYQFMDSPITLRRFFNPTVSPIYVSPTKMSKLNTLLQVCAIFSSLMVAILGHPVHPILNALWIATGSTTMYSGLQYMRMDRVKRFGTK